MSARQARFEVVRTDAGWHARFRAANGRIVWVTESYTRRRAAVDAIARLADTFSSTGQVWVSNVTVAGSVSADVRYGGTGASTWANAHRVSIRDIDERTAR